MSSPTTRFDGTPQIKAEGGRLTIPVPWKQAEGLQSHLRSRGIRTTLYLVPYVEEACIEVWPGTDISSVEAALEFVGN
jgi:hypothetical protein